MSMKFRRYYESPMILEALEERPPDDIMVITCDRCGSVTYYNQGSHAACEHCDANLDHLIGESITLADHFETLPVEEAGP